MATSSHVRAASPSPRRDVDAHQQREAAGPRDVDDAVVAGCGVATSQTTTIRSEAASRPQAEREEQEPSWTWNWTTAGDREDPAADRGPTPGCPRRRSRRQCRRMRLRRLTVGCFGGGTGLPSLLGGLKRNPWLHVNAVVTMFDSGGSSGELRDELGVLPPGRRAQVRAGAGAQRGRGAARAAHAAADARARAARRATPAATCCCR